MKAFVYALCLASASAISIPSAAEEQQALPYDTAALVAAIANASSDAEREQILKTQIRFPRELTPYLFIGNLYDKLNRPREAKEAYQKVLKLSPGYLGAIEVFFWY